VISPVLDTNTLVSAILVGNGVPDLILRAACARTFTCVSSGPIVAQVLRAFERPRVQRRYRVAAADIARLRRFLQSELVTTQLTVQVHGVATHPEDYVILATALSANADYLVTFDRQLLRLGSHQGMQIVSPFQFLTVLRSQSGS
jgi:putative PIN family toxin of toxin-antitoxin system